MKKKSQNTFDLTLSTRRSKTLCPYLDVFLFVYFATQIKRSLPSASLLDPAYLLCSLFSSMLSLTLQNVLATFHFDHLHFQFIREHLSKTGKQRIFLISFLPLRNFLVNRNIVLSFPHVSFVVSCSLLIPDKSRIQNCHRSV